MIVAVWVPLLVPLIAVPLARLIADRLPPRLASWLLAGTGAVLAACGTLALGLLAGAGLLPAKPADSASRTRSP